MSEQSHRLRLRLPNEPSALLTVAEAVTGDLGIDRLVFDQLLWWP